MRFRTDGKTSMKFCNPKKEIQYKNYARWYECEEAPDPNTRAFVAKTLF